MRIIRNLVLVLVLLVVVAAGVFYGMGAGFFGADRKAGMIVGKAPLADDVMRPRAERQEALHAVLDTASQKQILFGDLHVHTTFSFDGFLLSLPMLGGEGARPPANACDFARYCAALDFWSINDHAERLLPEYWEETKKSIRQCNAIAGDPQDPDLVSFLGWEWTQAGLVPENHYGHKNVILKDTAEDEVPVRPIASAPRRGRASLFTPPPVQQRALLALLAPEGRRQDYLDYARLTQKRIALDVCPDNVDVRALPATCNEQAGTPGVLFEKLRQWGFPAKVIPHGTSWGFYTPGGASWDKQLSSAQNDPELQTLFEVYSGHGNSEEYRPFRATRFDEAGKPVCPEPQGRYVPSCWRAGQIIEQRCRAAGETESVCAARAVEAGKRYVEGGVSGFLTVSGATPEDWLNAGQCPDCFLPALNYRPANSAQYALAITNFDEETPKRARFGFLAASDNHSARPGTGYKEYTRIHMTESGGAARPGLPTDPLLARGDASIAEPVSVAETAKQLSTFQLIEAERVASFLTTGGLTAVHSASRSRGDIWEAMDRREVYGTSGDRILLWFDLENAPQGTAPMGSEVDMSEAPGFTVRVAGAFKQKPGCPDTAASGLGADAIASLCHNECYNPSDERKKITHIDIIRIRPQAEPGEDVAKLIEDPWRRLPCADDGNGCIVDFRDRSFPHDARDTVYYARAVQEPSDAVNGGNLRCEYDERGVCVKVKPCFGGYRTDATDDCLAPVAERAWSSPIYVNYAPPRP